MKKETLLVFFLIALLIYIAIFRLPDKAQFKDTRDAQRAVHVISLRDSLAEYLADTRDQGLLSEITECSTNFVEIGSSGIDLEALVGKGYLQEIPQDPVYGTDSDSGYSLCQKEGQIRVYADHYQYRSEYYAALTIPK